MIRQISQSLPSSKFERQKNRAKIARIVIQIIVLIALGYLLVQALAAPPHYQTVMTPLALTPDSGFIALSFQGISREGSRNHIAINQLDQHLSALADLGFVSVSQQDIIDYFRYGTPLPELSLFLMFEDGLQSTMVFGQDLLARHNFRATMFTYANNLNAAPAGFLDAADLRRLQDNSFWEIGTNGYRLTYINVFDHQGNFFAILSPPELRALDLGLHRIYDHYLMDFIRDEFGVPQETSAELRYRIAGDYQYLYLAYNSDLGQVPQVHALMHPNARYFATHPQAGDVNIDHITTLFDLNFSREGSSFNNHQTNSGRLPETLASHDLTRLQVRPYWHTNRLLMHIREDAGLNLPFVVGDYQQAANWQLVSGAAHFNLETITLTSPPRQQGLLSLNGEALANLSISLTMAGNQVGQQSVYLRAAESLESYIVVHIADNFLLVAEKTAYGLGENSLFSLQLDQALQDNAPLHPATAASHQLDILLVGNLLNITLDGNLVASDLAVAGLSAGQIMLGSMYSYAHFGDWATADNSYDAIFQNLVISSLDQGYDQAEIILDSRLEGWQWLTINLYREWNAVLNWFIRTL